jgi:membrane protease YdiL (CAAX protease family)
LTYEQSKGDYLLLQNKNFSIEWMKRFAYGKPVLFSILIFLVAGLLTEIPLKGIFSPLVGYPDAKFFEGIIEQILVGLILVGLIVKLGLFKKAGFTPLNKWKALWLIWPLVVIAFINISSLIDGTLIINTSHPGLIILYTCLVLSTGFFEETLGRGLILSVMLQKWGNTRQGIYLAVFVSSAIFGVAHIFNLVFNRLPLLASLTQIVYTFFFGVIFAACFLRNNSIWPVIIIHAAIDFGGDMLREITVGGGSQIPVTNSTFMEVISTLIVTLLLFLYGIFILRKVIPSENPDHTFVQSVPN